MPRGPKGAKRPADVIGNAVLVMRIATGEVDEDLGIAEISKKWKTCLLYAPPSFCGLFRNLFPLSG